MQSINIAEPTKDEKQTQRGCITAGIKKGHLPVVFFYTREDSKGETGCGRTGSNARQPIDKKAHHTLCLHMEKLYLSYNQIHQTIKELSQRIIEDSFNFDYMVAIGTGGFIPARMIKTHINKPILTVGLAYYDLDQNLKDKPVVTQWLDNPEKQIKGRTILLVDEVDDTRSTIGYTLELLFKHEPKEIAVAVLHDKEKPKKREIPPQVKHYYRGLTIQDRWICYPWDADDILAQDKSSEI